MGSFISNGRINVGPFRRPSSKVDHSRRHTRLELFEYLRPYGLRNPWVVEEVTQIHYPVHQSLLIKPRKSKLQQERQFQK